MEGHVGRSLIGSVMTRSAGKQSVTDYSCLKRFRRRQLLALLRRDSLPATFDALKHETRVFLDARFLQRLVARGRWQEAREYLNRFLPRRDGEELLADAHAAVRFIAQLNVLDDLAHGKLGGIDAAEDHEMQIEAIPGPSAMADPHYTEAVCTVFNTRNHPAYWDDPVDWQLSRLKASGIVKDLVTKTPEFRHLLRLPHHLVDFRCLRRHHRKNIGRMSASLLARRFFPKERHPPSPQAQGSSSEDDLTDGLEELIDETLRAGKHVREHSDSCSEGSPVVACIGRHCEESSSSAARKHFNQDDCYDENAHGTKRPHTTGELCPDVVDAPSSVDTLQYVLNKSNELQKSSSAMASMLLKVCAHGPDRIMFLEKMLEMNNLLHEMRQHSMKASMEE